MKEYWIVVVVSIFVIQSMTFSSNNNQILREQYKKENPPLLHSKIMEYNGFTVEELTYSDVCYNGSSLFRPMEWWYFDAVFNNNYSIEFHINLFYADGFGVVAPMLNIYNASGLQLHIQKFLPATDFFAEENAPNLYLEGKKIIEGKQNAGGNWEFHIMLEIENCSVNLNFKSLTKGWKSKILNMWWWGVIQPKAQVSGTLFYNNRLVYVNGTGYQEHGWDGTAPFVKGWFWGKFVSKTLSVIWTNIIKNPWEEYVLLVVNLNHGNYTSIPPQRIKITFDNYTLDPIWKLPTSFHFNINDEKLHMNITVKTLYITHQTSIGLFNYWRYHVHVTGSITYYTISEQINNVQIMDYTRFW